MGREPVTFIELTAVLIVWFSNGTHTISTHTIDSCYALEAAVNNEEGADTSLVDSLYFPEDHAIATSALCMDPFPQETGEE
jgi:hypothetical protein